MWDAADGIDKTFPEIEELAAQCRFADCSHTAEPGCAVQGAVERGELPERRLSTVASISNTIRYVLTLSTTRIGEAAQYLGPSAVRTRTAASEGRLPSRRTGFGGPKL